MALRWDFNEKCGTVTHVNKKNGKEGTFNWYQGNSMMIVLEEYEENGQEYYNLCWFFMDEAHAKNCLGLSKGHDNMFVNEPITYITITRKYCTQWEKVVKLLTKAFPEIEIEITA